MNDMKISITVSDLPEVIEYIKSLKAERDYYKEVVKRRLPIYYINDDRQHNRPD